MAKSTDVTEVKTVNSTEQLKEKLAETAIRMVSDVNSFSQNFINLNEQQLKVLDKAKEIYIAITGGNR